MHYKQQRVVDFFEAVWSGVRTTSTLEWFAFLTGMAYVILAAKESIWCWLVAFISSSLFVYLCWIGQLYLESLLQLFYVVMAIIGYFTWSKGTNQSFKIKNWSVKAHILNIGVSGGLTVLLGCLFDSYTNQAAPYFDAFTTVFSLAATFMVTRKVIENWIYWIVIDIFSIYLYADRGFELLALQMFIFTIIATVGFFSWRQKMKLQMDA